MARIYRACVLGDLAKIAFEASTGTQIFTGAVSLGVTPVPLAHALGALAGAISSAAPARPRDPGSARLHNLAKTAEDSSQPLSIQPDTISASPLKVKSHPAHVIIPTSRWV
jgi:hypothetical protein